MTAHLRGAVLTSFIIFSPPPLTAAPPFARTNLGYGPYATDARISKQIDVGDVIQLANENGDFYHTLIISKIENGERYICANSNDALNRPLSSYEYSGLRVIHFEGVRYDTRYAIDCFDALYSPPVPPKNGEEGRVQN